MGVDEDTAAVVTFEDDRHVLRVIGRGAVTILDPSHIVSNAHEASRSHPILASGVVLHALPAGAAFDLTTRTLIARDAVDDATEAEQIAEAGRDLRRLARDIPAGAGSPSVLRRRQRRSERTEEARAGDACVRQWRSPWATASYKK